MGLVSAGMMKGSLRFEYTPEVAEKARRRRRRKVKTPQQPVVEVVNVQEKEEPVVSKWVSRPYHYKQRSHKPMSCFSTGAKSILKGYTSIPAYN